MSVFTIEDRDAVKLALIELATGARKVSVKLKTGTGDREFTYGQANISDLESLLARIDASVSGTRRTVYPRSVR